MRQFCIVSMVAILPTISIITSCATDSEFKQKAAPSSSAIKEAERGGATNIPSASFYLQAAKDELTQAKELASEGKKSRAASLLLRAEADAELANALSQEDAEKKDATDAMASVRQLRQDNQLPVNDDEGSNP
jgi:hypothetical protein